MKKKIILSIVLALVVSLLGYFSYKIITKVEKIQTIKEQIAQLPNFTFTTIDGKPFINTHLPDAQNILIVSFSPDCEFCIIEAKDFSQKASRFNETQIYFVSNAEITEIERFMQDESLTNIPNIHFLQDKKGEIYQKFNMKSIPYMVLYDKNRNFVKDYKGAINIDLIIKDIRNKR